MVGQTQSDIRQLLAGAGLAPQHRFGQNFLVDLNLMRKLLAAGELNPADTVLEVGPGTGSLTELLLEAGVRVVAAEIDRGFQAILKQRLGQHGNFTLIEGDALAGKHHINPRITDALTELPPRRGGAYKLVANLPYQIATPLLVDLCRHVPRFERLICTIQKEVGERLAAPPHCPAYGPVSVSVQTLARSEPIAILPASAFWPRPKIESIMLAIYPRRPEQIEVDDVPGFLAFVQRGFQQRRKVLRRLLRDCDERKAQAVFERAGVSPGARPEELSPTQWRLLFDSARHVGT